MTLERQDEAGREAIMCPNPLEPRGPHESRQPLPTLLPPLGPFEIWNLLSHEKSLSLSLLA